MARVNQPVGGKGSLHWIQRAVNEEWSSLNAPILARITNAQRIEWRSPLQADDYAEYRDGDFLEVLELSHLKPALANFWPARGPQWDALARTEGGGILIGEAKAHIAELCSPGTAAGVASREKIDASLAACAEYLGASDSRSAWTNHFYQLANRLAHLHFLRQQGVDAWLVLVNFLNDEKMDGPQSIEAWLAAYQVAYHVMGLRGRHRLSPYIIEVFPDLATVNQEQA